MDIDLIKKYYDLFPFDPVSSINNEAGIDKYPILVGSYPYLFFVIQFDLSYDPKFDWR